MNKNILYPGLAIMILLATSCDKLNIFSPGSRQIRCVVGVSGTKALPIIDDDASSSNDITNLGFKMRAYADGEWYDNELASGPGSPSQHNLAGLYFSDKAVTYSAGTWTIADDPKWLNNVGIKFFCYSPMAPAGSFSITKSNTSTDDELPFTYTVPMTGTPAVATNSNTEDIIFAYNSENRTFNDKGEITSGTGTYSTAAEDAISIKFYHALSQIRFCVSTDDGTFSNDLKILSIVLKGAKQSDGTYPGMIASGTCLYDGSANTFAWTPGTTMCNYTQTFGTGGADFSSISTSGGTTTGLPANWTAGSYTKDSTTYNLYSCTGDVLFVIPQDHDNCAVDITFQKGAAGTPFTLTGKLPDTDTWEAGKYYSYKIKAFKTLSLTLLKGDWIDGSEDLEF